MSGDDPTPDLHQTLYRYAQAALCSTGSAFVVVVAINADTPEVSLTAAAAVTDAAIDQEGAIRLVAEYLAHVVGQIDGGLPWTANDPRLDDEGKTP